MTHIAVLGYGTVGSGVVEVLNTNRGSISLRGAGDISVKYILDVRDFSDSEYASLFVNDFSVIENDPDVRVVVETIGGSGVALEFTRRALAAGKSVVTSNKEIVAEYGDELLRTAGEKNLNYLFEASVGGGIPIIRPISQCLAANEIDEIYGILNGTTNYILTRMIKAGLSLDDALREAKELGYAEQNPAADVEGHDACRKICILSSLAFGKHIYPRQVPTEGILNVTLDDVQYAKSAGRCIKLLGRASRLPGGKVCAYVGPHLVSASNPIANVEDVFNGIVVKGNAIGEVMFYGRGAGKLPTASAVVADVIDAIKHISSRKLLSWDSADEALVGDSGCLESSYYIRCENGIDAAKEIFGGVQQLSRADAGENEHAFITSPMNLYELKKRVEQLKHSALVLSLMRTLD